MVARSRLGLVAGALAAGVILWLPLPDGMSEAGRRTAAVTALMAAWWVSEAIPIAATALLPIFAFPLLGISSVLDACAPYAVPTNVFFLGGLMIAAAVERWGLHRRLALHVLHRLGGSPRRLVLGFMTATAAISSANIAERRGEAGQRAELIHDVEIGLLFAPQTSAGRPVSLRY